MKEKLPNITLPSGNYALCVDATGAICESNGEGGAANKQVTAAELDRIAEHAQFMHNQPKPPKVIKAVTGGHTVTFSVSENDGSDCEGKPGDVYIGCERVPYGTVMRAHKLSLAMRSRRARKQQ